MEWNRREGQHCFVFECKDGGNQCHRDQRVHSKRLMHQMNSKHVGVPVSKHEAVKGVIYFLLLPFPSELCSVRQREHNTFELTVHEVLPSQGDLAAY